MIIIMISEVILGSTFNV